MADIEARDALTDMNVGDQAWVIDATGDATVSASPQLDANCLDAALIHEAAIGKIAGEQLLKLRTFGLTEEEAEERIIQGFLR